MPEKFNPREYESFEELTEEEKENFKKVGDGFVGKKAQRQEEEMDKKVKLYNAEKYLGKSNLPDLLGENEEDNANYFITKEKEVQKLDIPFNKIKYKENNDIEIYTDNIKLMFSYSLLDKKSEKYLEEIFNTDNIEEIKDNIKLLTKLIMKDRNTETSIDFINLLPPNYKILFLPNNNIKHGFMIDSLKLIVILGDILTPRAIITLLHEIGHARDFQRLEKIKLDKLIIDHKYSDEAERLRKERAASAFALKKLKLFFKIVQFKKEDVINFLKAYALTSHSVSINQAVNFKFKKQRNDDRLIAEYETEQEEVKQIERFERFNEWKKTEEYANWKSKDENRNIDEYEEFGKWSEENKK